MSQNKRSHHVFAELLHLLVETGGEEVPPLDVALKWEQRILDAAEKFDEYDRSAPNLIDAAFTDRKRIQVFVNAVSALLRSGILPRDRMARWLLTSIARPTEREVRAGLFELLIASELHRACADRFRILDTPDARPRQKTTDFAIEGESPVEIKCPSGGMPALRDNLVKANQQHEATICSKFPRRGLTFLALPRDTLDEVAQPAYIAGVVNELELVFGELSYTGSVFAVVDEFKKQQEEDGSVTYERAVHWALFFRAGDLIDDVAPRELLTLCPKGTAVEPRS